jgi:hypothetical protein
MIGEATPTIYLFGGGGGRRAMAHELPLPPAAVADPRSLEMIRVWLAQGKQHCVLNVGFWEARGLDELAAWGVLLADLLHHLANAHEAEYGRDPEESLRVIRKALVVELDHPTSSRLGAFVAERQAPDAEPGAAADGAAR